MKKLSIKDLVEFRRKSDRAKKTFVQNIKTNKIEPPAEGGGDYWITGLSAVCNAYKAGDIGIIDGKIDELLNKISNTEHQNSKNMYHRNVAILQNYKRIDAKRLRPGEELTFLKRSTGNRLLTLKGLKIEAKPSHIYTFGKQGEEKVGAIWFIAKVNGYRVEELGMFCELLYRFLKYNYSKEYELSSEYCVAIDMLSCQRIGYSMIEDGELPLVLTPTLDEIGRLM